MDQLLKKQRTFFQSGKTLDVDFRIQMLKKLRSAVNELEKVILKGLCAKSVWCSAKSAICSLMCAAMRGGRSDRRRWRSFREDVFKDPLLTVTY